MIESPRNTKVYSKINSADVYCIYTIYLSDFRQIFYTLRAFDKKRYEGTFVRTLVKASYIVASKPVCTGIWAGTSISYWCNARDERQGEPVRVCLCSG